MDAEYENKLERFEIKKGQLVQVTVKEFCSELPQKGGNFLFEKSSDKFSSMYAVIKTIYEALPEYKGKRIFVEVFNKTSGEIIRSVHFVHRNKTPFHL